VSLVCRWNSSHLHGSLKLISDNNMEVLIVWLNSAGKIRLIRAGESLSSISIEELRKFSYLT
jgi:hypothetical protein